MSLITAGNMSFFTSLHDVLDKNPWDSEDIKTFLELDSSSVDEMNESGDTPLTRVLKNDKCSVDVIKLLLNYGSDINCRDRWYYSPLVIAVEYHRNVDCLKFLLENGADINVLSHGGSVICHAFIYYTSIDVIRLLLDAGCHPDPCAWGCGSVLHCAIGHLSIIAMEESALEGVLQLFIKRQADVNAVDSSGHSVLCSALRSGIQANSIKVLLAAGGVLNCAIHANPFLCATIKGTKLKTNVVQLLLEQGTCVNIEVLQRAVKWCSSETKAIELMLDHLQGGDVEAVEEESNNTLLHLAAGNSHLEKSVEKLLVKRGVKVNRTNKNGNTALHLVVKHKYLLPSVVKTLLKGGSHVNIENASGETALHLAMKGRENADTLKILLAAGARIGVTGCSLLKSAINKCDVFLQTNLLAYSAFQEKRQWYEMIMKFYFLENPDFDFQYMIPNNSEYEKFWRFRDNCLHELQKLDSKTVDQGRTLKEFLSGCSPFQVDAANCEIEAESVFFNQLLRMIAQNAFPLYSDIISAKVGRSWMNIKLKELQVYTYISDESSIGKKVVLNYHSVYKIADLLTDDDDLLRFISAFIKTDNHSLTGKVSKENIHEDKRSGEHSEQCCKRSKLHL